MSINRKATRYRAWSEIGARLSTKSSDWLCYTHTHTHTHTGYFVFRLLFVLWHRLIGTVRAVTNLPVSMGMHRYCMRHWLNGSFCWALYCDALVTNNKKKNSFTLYDDRAFPVATARACNSLPLSVFCFCLKPHFSLFVTCNFCVMPAKWRWTG